MFWGIPCTYWDHLIHELSLLMGNPNSKFTTQVPFELSPALLGKVAYMYYDLWVWFAFKKDMKYSI